MRALAYDREAAAAEAAEAARLRQEIIRARNEQIALEEDLAFVIAAIAALTSAADNLSREVTDDVGHLVDHVAKEDLDARDLLQALKDLSQQYFSYKNLSTATKNLTQYTDEYHTKFAFFNELRRISLGCVMAVDRNLISHEKTREQVERAYLANTDYWLAYAIAAVTLWWSDEREAAERAKSKALVMSPRKSALMFLFCNLKFGRQETAARWYTYYLGSIHANDVGDEYQYLLEAYLSGSFGNAKKLESNVGSKFDDMLSEIVLYNINFNKDVSDSAQRFMETKAHRTDFPFFYLPEYCEEAPSLERLLTSAEKNALVASDFEELAQGEDEFSNVDERLEDSIYNLIESMDPEEDKLYRRIKYNELIVAARGDISSAEVAYAERYPDNSPVSLGGLMQKWAFTEDDPRILPEVRRFSIGKLSSSIRTGFKQFADSYRAAEKERYPIHLGEWSFNCNENEQSIVESNYSDYFDHHQVSAFIKDKFFLIWAAMILVGIIGIIVAAAVMPHPALIVISILLVLAGGFLLWRQIVNIQEKQRRKKAKDLEIIRKTLEELGAWRRAYKEADGHYESLFQATYLFEE